MKLIKLIQKNLTPDLLKGKWKSQSHPHEGHCYVATEALYHLLPNKNHYKSMCASYFEKNFGKCTHWWLQHKQNGKILDPTKDQYLPKNPPYHLGKSIGFLTKFPSKRAQILINRVQGGLAESGRLQLFAKQ